MNRVMFGLFAIASLFVYAGCKPESSVESAKLAAAAPASLTPTIQLVDREVEASCGECQFKMEGKSCDLAIRVDGKSYFVDGSSIDDHGDAHGDDGMCQCVRKAKVSGTIENGRFTSTKFEVMPK